MYLHDVQGSCITDVGEGYSHGGIDNCLQFVEFLVPIERCLTVKQLIQNATQGPDVTGTSHLYVRVSECVSE